MLRSRARQNVVLELGYFLGRLGRTHVCALKRGELEIPSDFEGVVYVNFDISDGWK
jgi:predicted nucleotide-binding protein